jgi:hypothetical protein
VALDFWLQPGDLQLVHNHTQVHNRSAYEDYEVRAHEFVERSRETPLLALAGIELPHKGRRLVPMVITWQPLQRHAMWHTCSAICAHS